MQKSPEARALDRASSPQRSSRGRRARRGLSLSVAAVAVAGALLSACSSPAGGPAQPTTGLGANGPCTSTARTVPSPQSGQTVNIFTPGGTGATPNMGGSCNDALRPVAAVVHGLSAGSASLYQTTIDHLVSTGNIVIFATYNTDTSDFVGSFNNAFNGIKTGIDNSPRADKTKFGVMGHSMGGGAVPYLIQRAAAEGYGTAGFWAQSNAPWQIHGVDPGTISVPSNLRVIVEAYTGDALVSDGVGIDMYRRLGVPAAQKQWVKLNPATKNGSTYAPSHTTPNDLISGLDVFKFYGIFRNADALQSCAHANNATSCNTDLTFMGRFPDGTAFTPATSTDNP